jgi:hypothetical protein
LEHLPCAQGDTVGQLANGSLGSKIIDVQPNSEELVHDHQELDLIQAIQAELTEPCLWP